MGSAKLTELYQEAVKLATFCNEIAYGDKEGNLETELEKLDVSVKQYKMQSKKEAYDRIYAASNPTVYAFEHPVYDTIKVKVENVDSSESSVDEEGNVITTPVKIKKRSIVHVGPNADAFDETDVATIRDKSVLNSGSIDLLELNKQGPKGLGVNPIWVDAMSEFWVYCSAYFCWGLKAVDDKTMKDLLALGADPEKVEKRAKLTKLSTLKGCGGSVYMYRIINALENDETENGKEILSKSNWKVHLDKVVKNVFGEEYNWIAEDLRAISTAFASMTGIGSFHGVSEEGFAKIMLSVGHRIVTNGYYEYNNK